MRTEGNSGSFNVDASQGLFIVFSPAANNLVAGDTNEVNDIFVRDMNTGEVRLASLGLDVLLLKLFNLS